MKAVMWILSLLVVANGVQAQTGQGEVMDVELQPEVVEAQNAKKKKVIIQGTQVVAPSAGPMMVPAQQQPTTYVEASPLVRTRADEMRDRRQQAEAQTEQKIVERLEQSRMEDEKRRAERLFGNRFESQPAPVAAPTPVVVAPAPQPVVVPVAPVQTVEEEPSESLADIKNEIISSIKEAKKEKKKGKNSLYVSGLVGMADYVDVSNIDSNISTGVAVGRTDASGFSVEGSFVYSNFYVDEGYWNYGNPVFQEMDQYNFSVATKYSPMKGRLRPNAGALVSYVYRKYGEFYSNWAGNFETGNSADSKSFDMGFTAGVDVDVTDSFTVGFDYRYMMNITNKTSSPYLGSRYINPRGNPIEELSYQMFSLTAKARF